MHKRGVMIGIIILILVAGAAGFYQYHKTAYYAQIGAISSQRTDKSSGEAEIVRTYKMVGYNRNGDAKHLTVQTFNNQKFHEGRYLKVSWSRAKGVTGYERAYLNQIPQAAQDKLK